MQLSILVPSYNHEKYVLTTIRAAACVPVVEKEIVVIDDGSQDGTVKLIREFIDREGVGANVRLIARENRGLVRTLNEGVALARGKYLYLVASDDIPIPEGVARLVDVLEQTPSLQFALGNALYMDSEEQTRFRVAHREAHRRFFDLPFEERYREAFLQYPQPILLQATVFRTEMLRAMGGWREDIVADDYSFFLRAFSEPQIVGRNFSYLPDVSAVFYRQHGANSHRNIDRYFRMTEEALLKLCPVEWRNEALFRNFFGNELNAVRTLQFRIGLRFARSTVRHLGWAAFMREWMRGLCRVAQRRTLRRKSTADEPTIDHLCVSAVIAGASKVWK